MARVYSFVAVWIMMLGSAVTIPAPHQHPHSKEASGDSPSDPRSIEPKSASVSGPQQAEASLSDDHVRETRPRQSNEAPASSPDWYDRDSDRDWDRGYRRRWRGDNYGGYYDRDYYGGFRSRYNDDANAFLPLLGWTLLNQQSEIADLGMQLANKNFGVWNRPSIYGGGRGYGYY